MAHGARKIGADTALAVGYARVSTDRQDLGQEAQRNALELSVACHRSKRARRWSAKTDFSLMQSSAA